jgi:hypothetical protein
MSSNNSQQSDARKEVFATEGRCSICNTILPVSALFISGTKKDSEGQPNLIYKCRVCLKPLVPRRHLVSVTETQKTSPVSDEPCSDSIVEAVVKKLRSRSDAGLKKYGTTLERNDLTFEQWIVHVQEELMDAINYLERLKVGYNEAQKLLDIFSKLPK